MSNVVEDKKSNLLLELINPVDMSNSFVVHKYYRNRILTSKLPYTIPRDPRKWIYIDDTRTPINYFKEMYGCALIFEDLNMLLRDSALNNIREIDGRDYIWLSPDSKDDVYFKKRDAIMLVCDNLTFTMKGQHDSFDEIKKEISDVLYTWLCQYKDMTNALEYTETSIMTVHDLGISFKGIKGDKVEVETALICEVVQPVYILKDKEDSEDIMQEVFTLLSKADPEARDFSFGLHLYFIICRTLIDIPEVMSNYDLYAPDITLKDIVYDERYGRILCMNPYKFCNIYVCGREIGPDIKDPDVLRQRTMERSVQNVMRLYKLWIEEVPKHYSKRINKVYPPGARNFEEDMYKYVMGKVGEVGHLVVNHKGSHSELVEQLDEIMDKHVDTMASFSRDTLVDFYASWNELSYYKGYSDMLDDDVKIKHMRVSDVCKRILLDKLSGGYSNYLPKDIYSRKDFLHMYHGENTIKEIQLHYPPGYNIKQRTLVTYTSQQKVLEKFKYIKPLSENEYLVSQQPLDSIINNRQANTYVIQIFNKEYNIDDLYKMFNLVRTNDPNRDKIYVPLMLTEAIFEHVKAMAAFQNTAAVKDGKYVPETYDYFFSYDIYNASPNVVTIQVMFIREYIIGADIDQADVKFFFSEEYLEHEPFHGAYIPVAITRVMVDMVKHFISNNALPASISPDSIKYDKYYGRFLSKPTYTILSKIMFSDEIWDNKVKDTLHSLVKSMRDIIKFMPEVAGNNIHNPVDYVQNHSWYREMLEYLESILEDFDPPRIDNNALLNELDLLVSEAIAGFRQELDELSLQEFGAVVTDMMRPLSSSLRLPL